MKNNKGFTLIELLVVIAIIGLLSTMAVVSLNNARQKSRDAKRVADVKQLSTMLESEASLSESYPALQGCTTAGANTFSCLGPGLISQFNRFLDPSTPSGTGCTNTTGRTCSYSIANTSGGANPTTGDYAICFYLESGAGTFNNSGSKRISTGGVMAANCPW